MKRKVTAGKIWGLIYPLLIYLGISFVVEFVFIFLYMFLKIFTENIMGNYVSESLVNSTLYAVQHSIMQLVLISALATIPLMIFFMRRDIKQEKLNNRYKTFERVNGLKYLLIIPFAFFNMMWANLFVSMLQLIMPQFMLDSYADTAQVIYESSFEIKLIAAGLAGPIVEELIFRGLIYKRLTRMTNIKVAAIISSVLFGIYHGNWVQAPYAIILGLVCVYVYERYKSVVAPCILHMSANTIAIGITYVVNRVVVNNEMQSSVQNVSNLQLAATYIPTMIIFALLSYFMAIIIKKIVNPKEICK